MGESASTETQPPKPVVIESYLSRALKSRKKAQAHSFPSSLSKTLA
jgi:hypothetical protein